MANLDLWNQLSKTDPAHTKKFQRAGGFRGTSIKPIYMIRMMTDKFGPAGKGWGMLEPAFRVVEAGDCIMVYCTVGLWWESREQVVYGVGGDFVLGKNSKGPFNDDEAFKKSYTDALSNAMKQLGVGADVHMGQHDDDKYVAALTREIQNGGAEPEPKGNPPGISKFRQESREFYRELHACADYDQYVAFVNSAPSMVFLEKARRDFPNDWHGNGGDIKGIKEDMRAFCEKLKQGDDSPSQFAA
jgi:hypothetical protein